ncbi:hypothetical protein BDV33DRAFT_167755 [Aspergillus novoparasiticus]|uniref:Uncharacterized protein n=1 Tax=Aspergillus novoparasiticus TaxID=986946 RepID=A0A5N6F1C9_9EURO|nr:hypothetical protein BDV33DRAFT_167755 [Aspergillus novoparasiticus]
MISMFLSERLACCILLRLNAPLAEVPRASAEHIHNISNILLHSSGNGPSMHLHLGLAYTICSWLETSICSIHHTIPEWIALTVGKFCQLQAPHVLTSISKAAKPGRTGYVVALAFRFKFEGDSEYPGQAGMEAWFSLTLEPVITK